MSSVMVWVGGLMVLMPLLFAGTLLGALWYRNRKKSGEPDGREQA